MTKKRKPYITCNSCGIQLFVRGPAGIDAFNKQLEQAFREGSLERVKEMVRRYRVTCSKCGEQFWIQPKLIETGLMMGSLKGVRCPNVGCGTVLPWEQAS